MVDTIDIRGAASWSPDGKWIVTGGTDRNGPGLFKVPVAGGEPIRLVGGPAFNPVWSPDGNVILYSGPNVGPLAPLRAVRPDGTPFDLPSILLRVEGERYRFLPNGKAVVYMQGFLPSQDFWLLDLDTKESTAAHSSQRWRSHAHVRHHAGWSADRVRSLAGELRYRSDRSGEMMIRPR